MRFGWIVAATVMFGCSWTMSMQGPTWDPHEAPTCTDSVIPPVVDGAVAATAATLFIAWVTDGLIWKHGCGAPNQYGEHPCGTILPAIAASGGAAALEGYASYDGFRSRSRCHRRYAEYEASGQKVEVQPQTVDASPQKVEPSKHKVERNHGPYRAVAVGVIVVGVVVSIFAIKASQSFHL
jgi:hypothetical protein